MSVALVIAGIVVTLAVVVWFVLNRKNPEAAATHGDQEHPWPQERGVDEPEGDPPGP